MYVTNKPERAVRSMNSQAPEVTAEGNYGLPADIIFIRPNPASYDDTHTRMPNRTANNILNEQFSALRLEELEEEEEKREEKDVEKENGEKQA
ncbi:hypothetical protein EC957_001235 [Mortierella hygrophila]|uniref:Uncharacterized protein n=1 Tax=Mortierella hygrophila TaxID=979708 RepID=A0A9P6F547_9FUNG|nr:hypothetical protein EC957_001235 [Mortierella hygrophila]